MLRNRTLINRRKCAQSVESRGHYVIDLPVSPLEDLGSSNSKVLERKTERTGRTIEWGRYTRTMYNFMGMF